MFCLNKYFVSISIFLLFIISSTFIVSANTFQVVVDGESNFDEIFNIPSTFAVEGSPSSLPAPAWFTQKKSELDAFVTVEHIYSSGTHIVYLYDLTNYKDKIFTLNTLNDITYLRYTTGYTFRGNAYYYYIEGGKITTGKDSVAQTTYSNVSYGLPISYNTSNACLPLTYKGLNWNTESDSEIFPPPPSIEDDGQLGYKFIYPLNGENINLHSNVDSNYFKVPYKVDVKNFYAFGTKKAEEDIKATFKINDFRTDITTITWFDKPGLLGSECRYTVEGYFYIPISSYNNSSISLFANMWYPQTDTNWLEDIIIVTFSSDGSIPEYTPPDSNGNNGSIDIGGNNIDGLPSAPVDGSITDWFSYIGNLIFWLVTYPFKLLGNIIITLTGYITNMFNILQPVTNQLNSVLSFIPQDILNVCWGFLSFTILYSVLKSAFKMIRG